MLVKLIVTAEINLLDDRIVPDQKLADSVRAAVDNALALGADTGFEHELSEKATIHIDSVESVSA